MALTPKQKDIIMTTATPSRTGKFVSLIPLRPAKVQPVGKASLPVQPKRKYTHHNEVRLNPAEVAALEATVETGKRKYTRHAGVEEIVPVAAPKRKYTRHVMANEVAPVAAPKRKYTRHASEVLEEIVPAPKQDRRTFVGGPIVPGSLNVKLDEMTAAILEAQASKSQVYGRNSKAFITTLTTFQLMLEDGQRRFRAALAGADRRVVIAAAKRAGLEDVNVSDIPALVAQNLSDKHLRDIALNLDLAQAAALKALAC